MYVRAYIISLFEQLSLSLHYVVQFRHLLYISTFTPYEYTHKLYPYKHLQRFNLQIFEIDEITTTISLSMKTSSTTKNTTPLNFKKFAPHEELNPELNVLLSLL